MKSNTWTTCFFLRAKFQILQHKFSNLVFLSRGLLVDEALLHQDQSSSVINRIDPETTQRTWSMKISEDFSNQNWNFVKEAATHLNPGTVEIGLVESVDHFLNKVSRRTEVSSLPQQQGWFRVVQALIDGQDRLEIAVYPIVSRHVQNNRHTEEVVSWREVLWCMGKAWRGCVLLGMSAVSSTREKELTVFTVNMEFILSFWETLATSTRIDFDGMSNWFFQSICFSVYHIDMERFKEAATVTLFVKWPS